MRTGRPKQPLIPTRKRRSVSIAGTSGAEPAPLAKRARSCWRARRDSIIRRGPEVAVLVGMVGKWRARFLKGRLEALYDEPRPGAPRTVSDAQVEQVVIPNIGSTPRGETHCSTRGLAEATD